MNVLNTHLSIAKVDAKGDANGDHISGTCLSISLNPIFIFPIHRVFNLGEIAHICFTKSAFHTIKSIQNAYITLANHE